MGLPIPSVCSRIFSLTAGLLFCFCGFLGAETLPLLEAPEGQLGPEIEAAGMSSPGTNKASSGSQTTSVFLGQALTLTPAGAGNPEMEEEFAPVPIPVPMAAVQETTVDGTAYDSFAHSALIPPPLLAARGGNQNPEGPAGGVILTGEAPAEFSFVYDLWPDQAAFVETVMDWQTGVLDAAGFGTLPEDFVIGVKGPAGARLEVQIEDDAGWLATFRLNLTGDFQNYLMDLSGGDVPAGFDRSKILAIRFLMDRELAVYNYRGMIEIRTGVPLIQGDLFDESLHTVLTNLPDLEWNGGNIHPQNQQTGGILLTQDSSKSALYSYDLWPHSDSSVTAAIDWDALSWGDLSGNLVLGLKGPDGARLRVDVVDKNGIDASFWLALAGGFQNFSLDLTGRQVPVGFDSAQISRIQFYLDRELSHFNYRGEVEIRTAGLHYVPVVLGDAFDQSQITPLSDDRTVTAVGRHYQWDPLLEAGVLLAQPSPDSYSYQYDLWPDWGSFVENTIEFGPDGAGDLSETLVLGLKGPLGAWLKVEIEDGQGKTAEYNAQMVSEARNYAFDLAGDNVPAGFDRSDVRRIRFTLDRFFAAWNLRGTIEVKMTSPSSLLSLGSQSYQAVALSAADTQLSPQKYESLFRPAGSIVDRLDDSADSRCKDGTLPASDPVCQTD